MNCSNKYLLIWFYRLGSCISIFWLPENFLQLVCRKNVSGTYIVSAHFGEQHINLVITIIDFISFSSLVDWPMHKKGFLTSILWIQKIIFFCIMAWEPIFFQPWMLARHTASKIHWLTVIVVINNSREAFRLNESHTLTSFIIMIIIKAGWLRRRWALRIIISLKCPNVPPCFAWGEVDYGLGSTQKVHWIILLDSPSNPSQTQFNHILRRTSFSIHGSTCMSVMFDHDQELISLNVGLCSPNFAQRRGAGSWSKSMQ